jgi:hypothetical protein
MSTALASLIDAVVGSILTETIVRLPTSIIFEFVDGLEV